MQYTPASASPTPCVGREDEMARLQDLYAEAQEHGERLALVEGPSGIGKSRLLAEFRGRVRLQGGVVLEGRCEPGLAFGPFAEIVDRAMRFLAEVGRNPSIDLADLACRGGCHRFWYQHRVQGAHLVQPATVNGAVVEAFEKRLRLFDGLRGLLRDVAAVRAPVVMLHDLDRADGGTLQVLTFLLDGTGPWTREVAPERQLCALFVAGLRSDVPHPREATVDALRKHRGTTPIELGKLDPEGVRAFLQSPDTVQQVIERTGGMPEAIELLLAGDPLTPTDRVRRRMAQLSPGARTLVEALATVEHPTDIDVLARVGGSPVGPAERSEFQSSELVSSHIDGGAMLFSFARESDRQRAYGELDAEVRRELHTRCIDVYCEQPGHAQEGAQHALLAGQFDRAVPLALEAAHTLAARHAHGEAARLLEEVVEAVVEAVAGDAPMILREHLADLYRAAGDYKHALAHARVTREAQPTSPSATRLVGELLTLAGRLDEAADILEDAHRLAAATDDPGAVAEVEGQLGELHYQRASYSEARAWAERALSAARDLGEVALELHSRNTLGKLALAQKDAATAGELFEHNRGLAAGAGLRHQEAQALTNLGIAMLRRQDLASAQRAFARAIEVASTVSDTRERAIATENLAVLAHLRHDYAKAQEQYHESVTLMKRLGNRAMLAGVATNLGELYLSMGQSARARTMCDFASHVGGSNLQSSIRGEILVLLGRVEAAEGNTPAARACFEAALGTYERLRESRVTEVRLELVRAALMDGDVPEARRLLAEIPVQESPKRAAEVALVAVDVERATGGETMRASRRALERAEKAVDDEILLRALTRHARALCDAGDVQGAVSTLDRALDKERELTRSVPEGALDAWSDRPVRRELAAVEALVAASWARGDDSMPPRARPRPSSVPPAAGLTAEQERRWQDAYPHLVGTSGPMSHVKSLLDKVAPTDALVLIRGESGTGKELVAQALHEGSPRRGKPLIKVNCAALVETLLLSELFGHERGAFTGANSRKKGRFELADGGTIFLDEIGDISTRTQVALLRVLQEREFERVGGTQPIKVDVRIITATHRDLEKMVAEGEFREDLYYRLRGVMIEVPALRHHIDDLPSLTTHLLERIADERGEPAKVLSREALAMLGRHRWPGNVREIENVLRSATLFADSPTLEAEDFQPFAESFRVAEPRETCDPEPRTSVSGEPRSAAPGASLETLIYDRVRGGGHSLFEMKKVIERECIARALSETDGNITRAASLLGMKRPRLSQLVKQYELSHDSKVGGA